MPARGGHPSTFLWAGVSRRGGAGRSRPGRPRLPPTRSATSAGPAIGTATVRSHVSTTSQRQAAPLGSDHDHQRIVGHLEIIEAGRSAGVKTDDEQSGLLSVPPTPATRSVTCATGSRATVPADVRHAAAVTPAARRAPTTMPCAPNATAEQNHRTEIAWISDAIHRDEERGRRGLVGECQQIRQSQVLERRHLGDKALVR